MAMKLGDNTAKSQGRITLNPMVHLSLWGSVMMLLFGFGFAKPVPVNPYNFNRKISRKVGMAITSFAGPLSNLLLAYIALCILRLLNLTGTLYLIVNMIVLLNIGLAVFNLIPIPPLDGSRILLLILGERQYFKLMQYETYFFVGLMLLIALGSLTGITAAIQGFVLLILNFLSGWCELIN
jgi:Zn-dependent protease